MQTLKGLRNMKHLIHRSLTICLISTVYACGGSDVPSAELDSDIPTVDSSQDILNIEVPIDGENNTADIRTLPGGFTEGPAQDGNNTRSPQGIPNRDNNRRDNVRGARNNGAQMQPIMIDNREVRSYDGAGNNIENPEWGSTFIRLRRLQDANYSDGVSSMVFTDRSGPREISNTIVNQQAGESIPNPQGASDFSWQWGQFIDHDIDLTDGSADEPQNITVPTGDSFFDPTGAGTAIIPFNRAHYDPDTGTDTTNVREQENEITSWIDGSMIYGSDEDRAYAVRVGSDSPLMKTSSGNLLPFNESNLVNANGPVPDPTTLFLAGDVRVNEQVGLTSMHTLFVREHNRLARLLMESQPDASPESIFQAARRLVVAELQIITYEEHLPALIGFNAIPAYTGYDASIDPSIYNEFSAGAYRLGHSMVSEKMLRIGADGNTIPGGSLDLENAFFNAPQIIQSENDIDPILRGLASQEHQSVDVMVIHPLRNLLFGRPGAGGLDLTALNIQRGRDHGLPTYNDARSAMGLVPVSSFAEIGTDNEMQQSLQDAYGDVSKIDLWIGGLAESPLTSQGSQLGELFQAIVAKQFMELRDGDRFWYENYLNEDEMNLVGNTTLASVIRNNTNIGNELQNNVFYVE